MDRPNILLAFLFLSHYIFHFIYMYVCGVNVIIRKLKCERESSIRKNLILKNKM